MKIYTDNYNIANLELKQRMLPFIIKRPLPNKRLNTGDYLIYKLFKILINYIFFIIFKEE